MLRKKIFENFKKLVPKISDTEMIALNSGTTSIDRDIFNGKVDLNKLVNSKISKNPQYDKIDSKVNDLLVKYGDEPVYPNNKSGEIVKHLGKNKFFSFLIDDKYGGIKLSVNELSNILTKITSKNPSLGVTVMVPNSLGPGELLLVYGTQEQKDTYLPGLSTDKYVPCFGLTGPHNGSDATGSIDQGTVIMEDGKKYIDVKINKRYITLAPVSNLIGLAFDLRDPFGILEKGSEGVTVALIEDNIEGLIKETYHNPLNAGFPNGTLKGTLKIPIDNVIGGEVNTGKGWKMLMECLAAGRGICLPATANASSKVSTFGIYNYIKHRRQFKLPLIKMEGVSNKFCNMVYNTWLIQSGVDLTNAILDSGEKPAVISAIMKQQTTDRAREVLNEAMDIHAGSAICLGDNNFLEKFYKSAPIGITVEGSNVLTKNLIIFGQGLNKSHPLIFPLLKNLMDNNDKDFSGNFKNMLIHVLKLYGSSTLGVLNPIPKSHSQLIDKQTLDFANLANFVSLKGGSLKSEQTVSSNMADLLSNLYLAHSVKYYNDKHDVSEILTKYCQKRIYDENCILINKVIDDLDIQWKILLFPLKLKQKLTGLLGFENESKINKELLKEISNNPKIMNKIKENVFTEGTILEKLEKLNSLNGESYDELYNEVIQVGEYKMNLIS